MKLIGDSETSKYTAIAEIIEFCIDNGIDSYADLLLYSKDNRYDWFKVLCGKSTNTIMYFLRSMTWTKTGRKGDKWDERKENNE